MDASVGRDAYNAFNKLLADMCLILWKAFVTADKSQESKLVRSQLEKLGCQTADDFKSVVSPDLAVQAYMFAQCVTAALQSKDARVAFRAFLREKGFGGIADFLDKNLKSPNSK
ncbi:hypothetical protein HK101_001422 [Irineochytrium annulatum]|nr:hypothetical protein HK101_001422 [Irineochytrium annulatum]